jgi:hypothetical protein
VESKACLKIETTIGTTTEPAVKAAQALMELGLKAELELNPAAPPIAQLAPHPAQKHPRTKLPRLQSEQQTTDDGRTLYLQLSSFCPNRQNLNGPRTANAIAPQKTRRDRASAGAPLLAAFSQGAGGCITLTTGGPS